jgi:hypothetical protein
MKYEAVVRFKPARSLRMTGTLRLAFQISQGDFCVTISPGHRLPIGYNFTAPQRPAFPYVISASEACQRRSGAERREKP